MNKNVWFAFVDLHNQVTIVKYKSQEQVEITERMPFVRGIFDAFEADNYFEARCKIEAKVKAMKEERKLS